ncbi:MAG: hypothetical protein ABI389_14335 [Rhodanobacter sp.]
MRRFRIASWLEQGSVIERSGQIRQPQEEDRTRGLAWLDSHTRETLGGRRWRQPAPLTRRVLALALVLVLVLHALFVLALWYEMQPKPPQLVMVPVEMNQALIVRLIDPSSTPRAVQPPAPPTPPELVPPRQRVTPRVRPVTHEKPRRDAMVVQDHEARPARATSVATPAAINLFAKDGSVRLAPATSTASATASAEAKPTKPADDRQIMQHDSNRMHYKATRFEKYFPPPNETAGGAVGRHVGDAIKAIAKSMCDPHKRSTASNMLCGVPPIPPSPKDGDERLNLPPPSLANDPHPTKPPPLSSCIAEYKDTRPLSYGCPVNTPDLAFKAEMRECIDLFRAGKRLKTWCPVDTPKRAAAESSTEIRDGGS